MRHLRERLRLITPHWPSYPIILGDFHICEPEEGRSNVWNQTFTDGDAGKTAMFSFLFFQMFSRLLNLVTQGGTPRPLRSYAFCQGLIASLLTSLWLRREMFTPTPMSSRIWETGPFRVVTRRYVFCHSKSRLIEDNSANAFQIGCSNITFFCSILKRLHDDPPILCRSIFGALAEFQKLFLERANKQTVRELSRKTPDSLGAKLLIASSALRAYRNRPLGDAHAMLLCMEAC